MKTLEKIRAKNECRKYGHNWLPNGTQFDCDNGMGGGRTLYVSTCARCGKRVTSPFSYMRPTPNAPQN